MDFNVADFEDALSADVTIKHPTTGAPTPLVIQLAGPEHPSRKRASLDRQRRVRAHMAKTGKVPVDSPEEAEEDALDYLATCTLGWTPGCGLPEFSTRAARELYADSKRQWLRRQVQAALDEAEAFIARSVTG